MKRIFKIAVTLALCLIMTGCGKSRLAKEADAAIKNIGTVTLDSYNEIQAAQQAFDKLTYEEKQTVDFIKLEEAKQKYNYLIYAGDWQSLTDHKRYFQLGENGEYTSFYEDKPVISGTYKTVGNTIDISCMDEEGIDAFLQSEYTIKNHNGKIHLFSSEGSGYIRQRDYTTSIIEINEENYLDFFDVEYKFNIITNPYEKVVTKPREVSYHGYLILKPEYAQKLCSAAPNTNNYLRIVYKNSLEYQLFKWDVAAQNLVYQSTRLRQDSNTVSNFTSEIKQSDLWESMVSKGIAQAPFAKNYGSYIKNLYDIGIAYDYMISAISGTLEFYDETVYGIDYDIQ